MAETQTKDLSKFVSDESRRKALEVALGQIEKDIGKNAARFGGEIGDDFGIQWQRVNIPALSFVMGKGIPRGRILTLFGPESGGKSLIAELFVASIQRQGGICAWHDWEWSFDPNFVRKLGVDYDKVLLSRPETAEDGFAMIELLARSQAVDLLVVDSIPAMLTKEELTINMDGKSDDDKSLSLAAKARFLSSTLPKLVQIVGNSPMSLVFVNQLRDAVGNMWGPTEVEPGGRAIKFYSSIRIDVRRMTGQGAVIKTGVFPNEKILGHNIIAKAVKNKCATPFRSAQLTLMYESGIDTAAQYIKVGLDLGVFTLNGNTYVFGTHKLVGREALRKALVEDPKFQEEVVTAIDSKLFGGETLSVSTVDTASTETNSTEATS
jgi:recombination protein RecA